MVHTRCVSSNNLDYEASSDPAGPNLQRNEEETETRESGEPVGPRVRRSFCPNCKHCPTAPPRSPVCLANSGGSVHFRGHLKSQGTSAQMVWICHLEAETQANFPPTQGMPTAACEPLDPQGKGTLPAPTALSSMLLAPRDVSCRERKVNSQLLCNMEWFHEHTRSPEFRMI